jgi:hypothetical protein
MKTVYTWKVGTSRLGLRSVSAGGPVPSFLSTSWQKRKKEEESL